MISGFLVATAALISANAPGWTYTEIEIFRNYVSEGRKVDSFPVLHLRDAEASPAFLCADGSFRVVLFYDGGDFGSYIERSVMNVKRRKVRIFIDDAQAYHGKFLQKPARNALHGLQLEPAAKLYNAAIRGQPASFQLGRRRIALTMPPVDDDFRAFGKACEAERAAETEAPS